MANPSPVIFNKSAIGASALKLTATSTPVSYGVYVQADPGNSTGKVAVGLSSAVTIATSDATDGYVLGSSDAALFIPALDVPSQDASNLYVIGSTTGLRVSVAVF